MLLPEEDVFTLFGISFLPAILRVLGIYTEIEVLYLEVSVFLQLIFARNPVKM